MGGGRGWEKKEEEKCLGREHKQVFRGMRRKKEDLKQG